MNGNIGLRNWLAVGLLGLLLVIPLSSIGAESIGISSDDFMHEKNIGLGEITGIIPGKKDLQDSKYSKYTIEYFEYCIISGTYTTKTSSDEYQIIAESDTKSIIVTGWAWVLDFGDIPQVRFCRVKTDSIRAETFIGICTDGNVRGKGYCVKIGDCESAQVSN